MKAKSKCVEVAIVGYNPNGWFWSARCPGSGYWCQDRYEMRKEDAEKSWKLFAKELGITKYRIEGVE